jgi:hypothetical protein
MSCLIDPVADAIQTGILAGRRVDGVVGRLVVGIIGLALLIVGVVVSAHHRRRDCGRALALLGLMLMIGRFC